MNIDAQYTAALDVIMNMTAERKLLIAVNVGIQDELKTSKAHVDALQKHVKELQKEIADGKASTDNSEPE